MRRPLPEPSTASPADDAARTGTPSVQSVGMAFEVLEVLAEASEALGTSELARRLDQTKARVHRHLSTLRELGFVEQDASAAYRLGWRAFRLGLSVGENFGLRKLAQPHLRELQQASGHTVALATPAGADITVVDTIQSSGAVAITVRPGSLIPASSSALGRALLAFQPEEASRAALDSPRQPASASREPRRLKRLLEAVREQWWSVAVSERLPGVAALAAPVFDRQGRVLASVGLIGSQAQITDPPTPALVRLVQQAAAAISRELHSSAWEERLGSVRRRRAP
ncbi:IclR family transcriptional regulator [Ramlibacter rhizophilus]|uniref:IclR family transcriptional regulator n=1 Tax=Ramlibacter rhizophilus TaxID=1781167 RepID=A0A4Z0BKH4_9BURK|nr:IclR family transcriptional regulator [Ramlibacter rhizophilus]TFY99815.1 IclR family transcriptional regulator [Ramlibacter rhizophilus]